jgi:hypothetical protein
MMMAARINGRGDSDITKEKEVHRRKQQRNVEGSGDIQGTAARGGGDDDAQDDDDDGGGGGGGAREDEGGAVAGSGLMVSYLRRLSSQETGVSDWTGTDEDDDDDGAAGGGGGGAKGGP